MPTYFPAGMPGLVQFPSPFPDRTPGSMGRDALDGRLRIQIEIPNLPEGAKVTTETTGGAPEPEVNVGRANPLDHF